MVNDLTRLQKEIGEWGVKTFPKATPDTQLRHLKREVNELFEQHDPVEAADCLILLLGHAHRRGYDLFEEAVKKFKIIQGRKWAEPDSEGVQEHIREEL